MIKAEIVADSISNHGVRIITYILTYPRFIHSEFMTHRMFSRNASSSRAIPVKKSIQMVRDNPVIPLAFTKNKAGMQGGEVLDGAAHDAAVAAWLEGRDRALEVAEKLADLEVHKQYANRVLEPYSHISVVCTATEYDNFFGLRCHPMAQPEIMALADAMYEARERSVPTYVGPGNYHLPFITPFDFTAQYSDLDPFYIKRSVARCARVSYLNHDGKPTTLEEDLKLYDRLLGAHPLHASPAEHQAMATLDPDKFSGNLRGWIQYRKMLKGENITNFKKEMNNV